MKQGDKVKIKWAAVCPGLLVYLSSIIVVYQVQWNYFIGKALQLCTNKTVKPQNFLPQTICIIYRQTALQTVLQTALQTIPKFRNPSK